MQRRIKRRQAILSLIGAGAAMGAYTWRIEPHWLEFTYPRLPITGLPKQLEGCTLAQLSDLHVGPKVDDAYIIESFERVREHSPDFVVVTGDWITYRGPQQLEQLRRVLEHLPQGKLGTVGILGNHDYGFDWRMVDVAEKIDTIAQNAGATILRNRAVTIGGLRFLGLDDLWSPFFDPVKVLSEPNASGCRVVL